ncbi:MAG: glycosyltransferase family 32 protein [Christensenellales bacterium]
MFLAKFVLLCLKINSFKKTDVLNFNRKLCEKIGENMKKQQDFYEKNKADNQKIPKVLNYIWVGGKPKPQNVLDCIESWKKFCPDYEIKEWNESNLDLNANDYVKQAYENKKFAFVSDYFRLYVLYNCGGIYLDTDVELTNNLDDFLHHSYFSGFENIVQIPTAVMGCEKHSGYVKELMDYYNDKKFIQKNGKFNIITNVQIITAMTKIKYNIQLNNTYQELDDGKIVYYPNEFFCPKDYVTGKINLTSNTHAIHHFNGSWLSTKARKLDKLVEGIRKVFGEKVFKKMAKFYLTRLAKKDIKKIKKTLKNNTKNK